MNSDSSGEDANDSGAKAGSAGSSSGGGGGIGSQMLKHQTDQALLEPYRYISSVPGKDVRGKLIDCFQLWLQVDEGGRILSEIKEIVALLHNASLLVDDIEDNSKLRRGVPVAHSIFGIAQSSTRPTMSISWPWNGVKTCTARSPCRCL